MTFPKDGIVHIYFDPRTEREDRACDSWLSEIKRHTDGFFKITVKVVARKPFKVN